MKISLRQFLFFIALFAILVPIVAMLGYFLWQKPVLEKEAKAFLRSSVVQNSKVFLSNFRQACMILNEDLKNSPISVLEKENKRNELKSHIINFLETNKIDKNSHYWIVDLVDSETSIVRVSSGELRKGTILEATENIHLHRDFLNLLAAAKEVKKENVTVGRVRAFNSNEDVFNVYTIIPVFNWLVGVSFDMKHHQITADNYMATYTDYHLYNLIYFSLIVSFFISALAFYFISFISRDLKVLQSVLECLKRGNLTEAKYVFRMLSFDTGGAFMQMNILEMDVLEYINDLYKKLRKTKTLSDKVSEISKHCLELIFETETVIKDQNLSVKQSALQSDAIVFSANSLNLTALNSSSELLEFLKTSESANESLNKLKTSILNLSKASRDSSKILEFISGLTVKIKEVVLDINKVSENANLVSFNIAIEAEKVGVEGLALSLLSKEIHYVAVDTKKLTEQIELSAMDLQNSLNTDLSNMTKFGLKMQDTNYSLSVLAGNLGEIVKGVNILLRGFESLSSIITEQFEEAHNLSTSMISLNSSGEEISSNITNFKAENESLMQSARELKAKVSEFHF